MAQLTKKERKKIDSVLLIKKKTDFLHYYSLHNDSDLRNFRLFLNGNLRFCWQFLSFLHVKSVFEARFDKIRKLKAIFISHFQDIKSGKAKNVDTSWLVFRSLEILRLWNFKVMIRQIYKIWGYEISSLQNFKVINRKIFKIWGYEQSNFLNLRLSSPSNFRLGLSTIQKLKFWFVDASLDELRLQNFKLSFKVSEIWIQSSKSMALKIYKFYSIFPDFIISLLFQLSNNFL